MGDAAPEITKAGIEVCTLTQNCDKCGFNFSCEQMIERYEIEIDVIKVLKADKTQRNIH